ncbi:hypothetical protein [Streptomyces sp. NPDC095613]|uniref:hypothetical protein n=1 Tax=Streptomyces sp. NPDC095613 TaxID=3155540 RepID=UPI00331D7DFF
MPGDWKDGPFLGNGLLGVQVYRGATANSLKVMVGHSQVQDQRPQWRAPYGFSRLPIGHFDLTLAGEVTGVDWTLDLWDAELRGTVTTTRGGVRFSMLVHNTRTALLISTRPSVGEEAAAWSFTWMSATSPRTKDKPADYTGNPGPRVGSAGDAGARRVRRSCFSTASTAPSTYGTSTGGACATGRQRQAASRFPSAREKRPSFSAVAPTRPSARVTYRASETRNRGGCRTERSAPHRSAASSASGARHASTTPFAGAGRSVRRRPVNC